MNYSSNAFAVCASLAAFGLGLYNVLHARRAPIRARQRELRSKLRDILYELKHEWQNRQSDLVLRASILPEAFPKTRDALPRLDEISGGLEQPDNTDVQMLMHNVAAALSAFERADPIDKLVDWSGEIIAAIDRALSIINDMDRGSRRNRKRRIYQL
jgi:hypothetical protein